MKANSWRFMVGMVCALGMLGPRSAAAQSTPAPCGLLTPAQVSAAIGSSVGAGEPIATTGCTWASPHVKATLSLWDATEWEKMKAPLPGMSKSAIGSLGDDAFFATVGTRKQLTTLTVKKAKTAYVFHIYGIDNVSDQMSMEKTLAGIILAKL
jgi:hypothetical protein